MSETREKIIEDIKENYRKDGEKITHEQAVRIVDDLYTLAEIALDSYMDHVRKGKEKKKSKPDDTNNSTN